MMPKTAPTAAPRLLTGRMVLVYLLGFFGIVAAANAVLIHEATSTFGGVETENAYKAGLSFGRDIAAARAQDALHWRVEGSVHLDATGKAVSEINVTDAGGHPIAGIEVFGLLSHPTNRKLDRTFTMTQVSSDRFRGTTEAAPGQWDFIVDIDRNSEQVFQSRTRVLLK